MKKLVFKMLWCFLLIPLLNSCESKDKSGDEHGVDDPEAQMYRMFIDDGHGELQSKKFNGRIQIADWEERFGPLSNIPIDELGNYYDGWKYDEGLAWRLIAGPNFNAINILTIDMEGNISSCLDLNGDRIADVVDIRLANRERFTFVTEHQGLAFFESWALGQNPLCKEQGGLGLDYPLLHCEEEGASNPSGLPGGGPVDLLEELCADYYETSRNRLGNMAVHGYDEDFPVRPHVGRYNGSDIARHERRMEYGPVDAEGRPTSSTRSDAYVDEAGNNVVAFRIHATYENGSATSITQERVNADGEGVRIITTINDDGSRTVRKETFTTDTDAYIDDWKNEHPPTGTPVGSDTTHPGPVGGPFGPETDIAAWCEAQIPYESGAERAARKDPAAFRVSCDDLVGGGVGDDCTIVEWASPANFDGSLETPSAAGGCGPFEEPGPDGTCGTATGIQRLKGLTGEILSANLGNIVICDPTVCNLGDL